ncbi:Rust resistance kinase Lr10 [Vitis vinifera]|uniref:non-specific serine/threonine protein kinase n=1 Tax=Vitis vinifera TaxID=29760 RepID=A0A438GQK3_VITVI|nr:Rust resistance kinase Lr10 [Vitis vinifera]
MSIEGLISSLQYCRGDYQMSISLKMVFLYLCCCLTVIISSFAETGVSQDECMVSQSCSLQGPPIHFPFRLKGHQYPDHCGCSLFALSCTERNQTILELPDSVNLLVKEINYRSKEILVQDPDNCFPRQFRNLNLTSSPFQFLYDYSEPSPSSNALQETGLQIMIATRDPISCLRGPGFQVYAVSSWRNPGDAYLPSCSKMYNVAAPPSYVIYPVENATRLKWPKLPHCEAEGATKKKLTKKKLIVIGEILGSLFLVTLVFALYRVYSSNELKRQHKIKVIKFLEDYRALKPSRYSYNDIKRITDGFKEKLGEGGYGTVYKGKLSNEILVAVKILNYSNGNGEEFINEVGTIGRIHHINVVRLIGFCSDGYRRALIYEFLSNESLEKFIFSNHSLGWEKLQDIAIGIAKGIEYLHQGCDQRILHFDIKPHNILLDHNFNPKISDFGLAKLCSKEQSAVSMSVIRGTMGYIAPEMISRNFGNVSYKSDVYSFGMLLIEMVGGRKNIDTTVKNTSQVYFPEWVYNRLDKREELHIPIEEENDGEIAKKLLIVGLWCIQWCPTNRPSMKFIIQMLEGEGNNLSMPPNPFTSMGPTRTSPNMHQQELAVISEIE